MYVAGDTRQPTHRWDRRLLNSNHYTTLRIDPSFEIIIDVLKNFNVLMVVEDTKEMKQVHRLKRKHET